MRRPELLRRASFFTLFPLVVGVFALFIASVSAYVPFQQARRIANEVATGRAADKASVAANLLHQEQRSLVGFARATSLQLGETGDSPADVAALGTFVTRLSGELEPATGGPGAPVSSAPAQGCRASAASLPAVPEACGAGVLIVTRTVNGIPAAAMVARAGALLGDGEALARWLSRQAVAPPPFAGNPDDGVPWMFATYPVRTPAGIPTGLTVVVAQPNIVDDLALELRSAGTDQPQVAIVRDHRYVVGGRIAGRLVGAGEPLPAELSRAVSLPGAQTVDLDGGRFAVAASLLGDGNRLLLLSPVVLDPGALITPGLVISWVSIVIILLLVTGHFFTRHWQMLKGAEARAAVATHLDAPRPLPERLEAVCRQLIATTRAVSAMVVIDGGDLPGPYVCHVGLDRPDARRLLGDGPVGEVAALRQRNTVERVAPAESEEARCGMRRLCAAPLLMGSGLRGVVVIADRPRGFIDADRVQLADAAERLALAVERDRILSVRTMEASTDPLTGLPNRRSLVEHLERQLAIAERANAPLSVLMLDLDRLKEINDTHGHAAGDEALRAFARTLSSTIRRSDLAARLSGDEFVIVMANTRGRDARDVAEKIRAAVTAVEVRVGAARAPIRLGVSIGGVAFPEVRGGGAERLLERADAALYEAKREGRNRVRFTRGRISAA
ncbi:MAG TPA: sensor domain-containing diguanylate cyclase [Candidatus Dormibacteraeota bacterium]